MGGADEFAIVTPGVGKGGFIGRLVTIESETCRLPEKMGADECLLTLTVGRTMDLVGQSTTILGEELDRCQPAAWIDWRNLAYSLTTGGQ